MTAAPSAPAGASSVRLACRGPAVLATGAWFKNTVCRSFGDEALLSANVGDLDTPEACVAHEETLAAWSAMAGAAPRAVACDLHPDFHSSRSAAQSAQQLGVPLIPVQHHHAHIAALCAEHGVDTPVLGLALDGVGLGSDNAAWGGELLLVDGARFERLGHLRPLALPGGDRAAREPWRMAASALHALGRGNEIAQRFADEAGAATVAGMLARGLNCPATSSTGRLFDAAAGLLNLSRRMDFEAQAAIALEQAATRYIDAHGWPKPLAWDIDAEGRLDLLPTLALLAGRDDADAAAAAFHSTLVFALAEWTRRAADLAGIGTVACGGGCFLNKLLSRGLRRALETSGFDVLEAQRVSPGDAAIALGQAWVAQRSL